MLKRPTAFLRSERGIALPIALGMMLVLSIMLGAVLVLSQSSEQTTKRENAGQRAFGHAEAGVDKAASILISSTDPSVPGALPTGSPEAMDGGTSAYSASLSGLTWTITGTGTVPNPIAGGAPLTRQVSRQYTVTLGGTVWEWVFVDQPSGCMTIRQNAVFMTPLWINGNLCINNNAVYTAPRLYVGGTLSMSNTANVGSPGSPIQLATIVGGCTGGVPNPHPCTSTDRVWANTINQTPSTLARPTADFARWYSESKPGPLNACNVGSMPGGFDNDTTRNRSRPVFDLSPGSSYDCRFLDAYGNTVGQMTWSAGTNTLTVAGTIFIDGDITHSGTIVYSGRATIYASGKITFTNNATVCGVAGCTNAWDTSNNVLMLVAGSTTDTNGVLIDNGAIFQGSLYAVNNVYLDNDSAMWGPIVARSIYVDNNADQYKALIRLPPGSPGIETTVQPVAASWRG